MKILVITREKISLHEKENIFPDKVYSIYRPKFKADAILASIQLINIVNGQEKKIANPQFILQKAYFHLNYPKFLIEKGKLSGEITQFFLLLSNNTPISYLSQGDIIFGSIRGTQATFIILQDGIYAHKDFIKNTFSIGQRIITQTSSGKDVQQIKEWFNNQLTLENIKNFQKENFLEQTGVIDYYTLNLLENQHIAYLKNAFPQKIKVKQNSFIYSSDKTEKIEVKKDSLFPFTGEVSKIGEYKIIYNHQIYLLNRKDGFLI